MTRTPITYTTGGARRAYLRGHGAGTPTAGFYRFRLRSGGVVGGVRIWFGPPHDPVTGEELDRSWRWQAEFDGEPVDVDRVWPACGKEPVSEAEYARLLMQATWARQNAPGSAYADHRQKIDRLSKDTPLPF